MVKHPFYSLILFLSPLNCLSEFPCSSLSFFMTAILNSLYVRSQYSVTFSLVSGDCHFLFVVQCYCGSLWCLVICSSASAFEVANSSVLDSALPLVISESWHFSPSAASVRGVAPCLPYHFLCLRVCWCLAVATVTGIATWGTRMKGFSAASGNP